MIKALLLRLKEKSIRKFAINSIWLTIDNLLRLAAGFFIGIWVARYLGPGQLGGWNYALSFVSIFAVLIGAPLNDVVVREIIKFPHKRKTILGSAFFLKLGGALVAFILAGGSVLLFSHQSILVKFMVIIVAFGTIFQSFEVISYWFESEVHSSFAVIARSSAFIVASTLKVVFVFLHFPVQWFAYTSAIEIIICAIAYLIVYQANKQNIFQWKFDARIAKNIFISGAPLIIAGILATIYSRFDKILVGSIVNQAALGNYSVGTMLTDSWSFVATAITISVYPSIIYTRARSAKLYERRMKKLYSFMMVLAIVLCLPISLLSHKIIMLLYGPAFSGAAQVLSIYVWIAIPAFLDLAGQKWLYAENLQKYIPIKTFIGSIISICLNLLLIPRFGILGAAITALISISIATFISNLFFRETRPLFWSQVSAILRPDFLGLFKENK